MKKLLRILIVMFTITVVSTNIENSHVAHAQVTTYDALSFGQRLKHRLEEAAEFLESINTMLETVTLTGDIFSSISQVYNMVSPFITGASVIRDIYENYLLVKYDIERVQTFLSLIESGYVSPMRIYTLYCIADKVLSDAYTELTYMTETLLNPLESATMVERLEEIRKINDKFKTNSTLIDNILDDIKKDMTKRAAEKQAASYVDEAFHINLPSDAPTITPSIDFSDIPSLSDPRNLGGDVSTDVTGSHTLKDAEKKFTDSSTVGKIFNIASLLIGIIAVGYTVWNFAMKNSGERQRQDSQFKVFAGMLIGILLLQALKAMFF